MSYSFKSDIARYNFWLTHGGLNIYLCGSATTDCLYVDHCKYRADISELKIAREGHRMNANAEMMAKTDQAIANAQIDYDQANQTYLFARQFDAQTLAQESLAKQK